MLDLGLENILGYAIRLKVGLVFVSFALFGVLDVYEFRVSNYRAL